MACASSPSRGAPGWLSAATTDSTAVSSSVITMGTNSASRTRISSDAAKRLSIFPGTLRMNSVFTREPVTRTSVELAARSPVVHRMPLRLAWKRTVREPSTVHSSPPVLTSSALPGVALKTNSDG